MGVIYDSMQDIYVERNDGIVNGYVKYLSRIVIYDSTK